MFNYWFTVYHVNQFEGDLAEAITAKEEYPAKNVLPIRSKNVRIYSISAKRRRATKR